MTRRESTVGVLCLVGVFLGVACQQATQTPVDGGDDGDSSSDADAEDVDPTDSADSDCDGCEVGYAFTIMAGNSTAVVRSIDGTGSAAQFYAPRGVAVDSLGNVFVTDSSNHSIRKVTAAGVATTLAGQAGSEGNVDGTGTAARFRDPYGLALDSSGNLYVADTSNNAIRKVTPAGVVTTFAGGSGYGSTDGTGTAAKFHEPRGLAVDASGNVYVADYENDIVRKITAAGVVTTLAGTAEMSGSTDGTGAAARFTGLYAVAVDANGTVFVSDTGNRLIRKISGAGVVTTFAGAGGGAFSEPRGLTVDANGTVYVADYGAHVILKVSATGVVSSLAGTFATPGSTDATGSAAKFYAPSGVAVDSSGNAYIADTANATIRKVTAGGVATTLAGLAGRSSSLDGTSTAARFEDPYAAAVDTDGNVYVADAADHTIRKITAAGVVTTLAGTAGSFGSTDGTASLARFFGPLGIAVDASGNVLVADTGNSIIRKITPAGVVTTIAGAAGMKGNTDATGTAARFNLPNGVAVDGSGNVYVTDTSNSSIRKITSSGVVTTLAGSPGTAGFTDGTGTAAGFKVPFDLAADDAGTVYVCDHGNHAIRMVTPAGVVTTLAGGTAGSSDGTGTAASFKYPSGIAVDASGIVYVADTDNQIIRQITAAGVVTTIAGAANTVGLVDGIGTAARFFNPKDIAVDPDGNLYVADRSNYLIRKGSL